MATGHISSPATPKLLLDQIVERPYFPWFTSACMLANVPSCVKRPIGYPPLVQLPLFALIFGFSGYMIHVGDPLNGSGTTTAWSLIYLFHAKKAVKSGRPGPIMLSAVVAAQAATFGYFYNERRASFATEDDD
ncbi:hypothetical protein OIV83_002463 [Microbotryomycetes sp. JL201]|nr:hypothetical protein OIV83_002463 [Microbotryomycetes sp. JL201]